MDLPSNPVFRVFEAPGVTLAMLAVFASVVMMFASMAFGHNVKAKVFALVASGYFVIWMPMAVWTSAVEAYTEPQNGFAAVAFVATLVMAGSSIAATVKEVRKEHRFTAVTFAFNAAFALTVGSEAASFAFGTVFLDKLENIAFYGLEVLAVATCLAAYTAWRRHQLLIGRSRI